MLRSENMHSSFSLLLPLKKTLVATFFSLLLLDCSVIYFQKFLVERLSSYFRHGFYVVEGGGGIYPMMLIVWTTRIVQAPKTDL